MIEEDDTLVIDDDFLSQIDELEAKALSSKRKNITNYDEQGERSMSKKVVVREEGAYFAALKGNLDYLNTKNTKGTENFSSTTGLDGGNACFKCGQLGHWSRDCSTATGTQVGGENNSSNDNNLVEKSCLCGSGTCLILTANTVKNPGRKFYKCPVRQENGGCGFFEWCDNSSATPTSSYSSRIHESASNTSVADLPCPCGAGSCLVLTAKTGNNVGQQFYRCPNQASQCGFFKWCNQQNIAIGHRTSYLDNANSKSYSGASGQSSFNVGRSYASSAASYSCNQIASNKGCSAASGQSPVRSSFNVGRNSASSAASYTYNQTSNLDSAKSKNFSGSRDICFKCGLDGHWAKDCPAKPSVIAEGNSSGSCYKCGEYGHWAKDCTGQDVKSGNGSRSGPASYTSYR